MPNDQATLLAIKLSVQIGQELQKTSYRVASAYTRGFSHAKLAAELKKRPEFSQYEEGRLAHAVRYALVGNHDNELGPIYEGLIPHEIYQEHSRNHRVMSGKSSGMLRAHERRGIHGLDHDKLSDCARKAAISRGEMPWSDDEKARILSLSLLEMFKMNGHVDYGSIAANLNNQFYDGKPVRTNVSVRETLRRMQRSFAKTQLK